MFNKGMNVPKILMVSLLLLLAACSKTEAEDANVGVIEKVLELQFNGPDKKLMDLLQNPSYTKVDEGKEINEEFDKYIAEVYGDYFTEGYLVPFFQTAGLVYQATADFSGHELKLKDADVKQTEAGSNRYTFTATVGYSKDGGKEKTADVSGIVLFSTKDKGKIGKFEYGEDNGLSKELSLFQ